MIISHRNRLFKYSLIMASYAMINNNAQELFLSERSLEGQRVDSTVLTEEVENLDL